MAKDKIKNKDQKNGLLKSFSKLNILRRLNIFRGISLNNAENKLLSEIDDYRKAEKESFKAWKKVELSRDENRPMTLDYIRSVFEDFIELSGDRLSGDDKPIITGLARIDGRTVVVVGQQKGKDTKEKVYYNFSMASPQGYRKAQRAYRLADKFGFPIITFVDTQGAYPAIEAEDAGQAGAIARSLLTSFEVSVPIIVLLIGEGGSGGALAIAVGNYIMMLENSTYSVISPEGCAAILWKDAKSKMLAARALKLTAKDLFKLQVVDRLIHEPIGGAQKNPTRMIRIVKKYLIYALNKYKDYDRETIKQQRALKFERLGVFLDMSGEKD